MKVIREHILTVLQSLSPVLKLKKGLLEANSYVVFDNKSVSVLDDVSIISYRKQLLDFTCAVKGAELHAALNRMKTKEVDITLDSAGYLLVTGGKVKAQLAITDKINCPKATGNGVSFTVTDQIKDLLVKMQGYVNANIDDYGYIQIKSNAMLTADGFILAKAPIVTKITDEEFSLFIPPSTIKMLLEFECTSLTVGSAWLYLQKEDYYCAIRRHMDTENLFALLNNEMDLEDYFEYTFGEDASDAIKASSLFASSAAESGVATIEIAIDNEQIKIKGAGKYGVIEDCIEQANPSPSVTFIASSVTMSNILAKTNKIYIEKKSDGSLGNKMFYHDGNITCLTKIMLVESSKKQVELKNTSDLSVDDDWINAENEDSIDY